MNRWHRLLQLSGVVAVLFTLAPPAGAQDDDATGAQDSAADGADPASGDSIEEEILGDESSVGSINGGAGLSDEQVAVELNKHLLTVEEDVNSLKERVFRSKATLQLLREIVIQGSTSGARAVIWHVNDLGAAYTLESVSYYLDGQSIFARADPSGSLDNARELQVWEGALPPGNHNLTINLVLRGNGFGVFKYVEDYTFRVQSSYAFVAEDGQISNVRVLVDERKGLRSFVERPNVEYDIQSVRLFDQE